MKKQELVVMFDPNPPVTKVARPSKKEKEPEQEEKGKVSPNVLVCNRRNDPCRWRPSGKD